MRPFRYKTRGMFAELGHRQAVAITLGVRWRGLPAWLHRTHLSPADDARLSRKLRLLVDWNVALVFGRDASLRLGGQPLEQATSTARAKPRYESPIPRGRRRLGEPSPCAESIHTGVSWV